MKPRLRIYLVILALASALLFLLGAIIEREAAVLLFDAQHLNGGAMLLLGMTICAAAIAMPLYSMRYVRREQAFEARRDSRPAAPWTWKTQWQDGRIVSGEGFPVSDLFVAVLWNALVATLTILMLPEWQADTHAEKWFVLCFPVAGVGLGIYAVRSIVRWMLYRSSTMLLDEYPVRVGDVLSGAIVTNIPVHRQHKDGFFVTLSCYRRVIRGARSARARHHYLLWRDQRNFRGVPSTGDPSRIAVPISFRLPADAKPTTLDKDSDRIVWMLETSASPGLVKYYANFELPVFAVQPARRRQRVPEEGVRRTSVSAQPVMPGATPTQIGPGITKRQTEDALAFVFDGVRHRRLILSLFQFAILFAVVIALIAQYGGPQSIVTALIACAIAVLAGAFATKRTRRTLEIKRDVLTVTNRFGPFQRSRAIDVDDITDLRAVPGLNLGRRSLFDIVATTRDNRSRVLVGKLEDKTRAEWITFQLVAAIEHIRRIRGVQSFSTSGLRADRSSVAPSRTTPSEVSREGTTS